VNQLTDFPAGDVTVDETGLQQLIDLATPSRRMAALTGAGISTESGIPDYRGPNGVWATGKIPTISDFLTNPQTRREYWDGRRTRYPELAAKVSNRGHLALAALQQAGRLGEIITQNIDGLHQKAGSPPGSVIELHGSAHEIKCLTCGRTWPAAYIQSRLMAGEEEPTCEVCGGILRAATVLFGESLPKDALTAAAQAAVNCDLFLVVGSSLVVNPAAQLPLLAQRAGAKLAIVNHTPTGFDGRADVVVRMDAGPALAVLSLNLLRHAIV
jgi:NAD-dependent deacetylase